MASYPSAVKTFTSKSDGAGNRIFAAHINDLQDEVTAIEDGLLNGTAPVNSSRVTAASLSVAGNSTLGGNVSVGGQLTLTGALVGSADISGASLNITQNSTIGGNLSVGGSLVIAGQKSTVLSTGDTHNISAANVNFIYVQTNSSGSTLTGIAGMGSGQFVVVYNAGPSAVLGLKNSSGSVSSNQFSLPSDTNVAVGAAVGFVHSALVNKWVKF